ncbi:MAG: hypothetical protein J6X55_04300 [Victivallales bacterium]|nr:hypothetical protein [Victivallales bacterium]
MKKMFVCLVSFICLTASLMAYKYEDDTPEMKKFAKMTTTQLRLAILERYDSQSDLADLISQIAECPNDRLISRFTLALQQVFTSKAAVSSSDRDKVASYSLDVMSDAGGKAYTAADGSYRCVIKEGTVPNYAADDDYKPVSASSTSTDL